jgi:hypothetical protein
MFSTNPSSIVDQKKKKRRKKERKKEVEATWLAKEKNEKATWPTSFFLLPSSFFLLPSLPFPSLPFLLDSNPVK